MGSSTSKAASEILNSLSVLILTISNFLEGFNGEAGNYDRNRQRFVEAYNNTREVVERYIRNTPRNISIIKLMEVQLVLTSDIARIMRIPRDPDQETKAALKKHAETLLEYAENFNDIFQNNGFWNRLKTLFRTIANGIVVALGAIGYGTRLAIENIPQF